MQTVNEFLETYVKDLLKEAEPVIQGQANPKLPLVCPSSALDCLHHSVPADICCSEAPCDSRAGLLRPHNQGQLCVGTRRASLSTG